MPVLPAVVGCSKAAASELMTVLGSTGTREEGVGDRRALWVHSSARASWAFGSREYTTIPEMLCARPAGRHLRAQPPGTSSFSRVDVGLNSMAKNSHSRPPV